MNLQDLRYFAALAEHGHFGRAARACHVSQPTLSGQLRKLEQHLGVTLFERTNKRVALTAVGVELLAYARRTVEQAERMEEVARASRDQLQGPLRLGVIPTLAPYLMPLILGPLKRTCPAMTIELWEDLTPALVDLVARHRLDAALLATEAAGAELTSIRLFEEPFLAALPATHPLAGAATIAENDLAADLLVLADGHCLAAQTLAACGRKDGPQRHMQAANLETLINLVAAGYGTTLVPALAAVSLSGRGVVLRPLAGGASRTIRLTSRPGFPRPKALRVLEGVIREAVAAGGTRG